MEGLWQGLGLWQRSLWLGRSAAGKIVAGKVCGRIRSVAEKSLAEKVFFRHSGLQVRQDIVLGLA